MATGGVEEQELIQDLPEDLQKDIQRYLCLELVKKVLSRITAVASIGFVRVVHHDCAVREPQDRSTSGRW